MKTEKQLRVKVYNVLPVYQPLSLKRGNYAFRQKK